MSPRPKTSKEKEKMLQLVGFLIGECSKDKYLTDEYLYALIYLADWHHVLHHQKTITGMIWRREKYGPESDVLSFAQKDDRFRFREADDEQQGVVSWRSMENSFNLDGFSETEQKSICHIASNFNFEKRPQDDLDEIVYATAPMLDADLGADIDLSGVAKKHVDEKDLPPWRTVILHDES